MEYSKISNKVLEELAGVVGAENVVFVTVVAHPEFHDGFRRSRTCGDIFATESESQTNFIEGGGI